MMKGTRMYDKFQHTTEELREDRLGTYRSSSIAEKHQSGLDRSLQHFDSCLERATKLLSQINSATDRLAGAIPEQPNGCAKDSIGSSGVAYEVGYRCARLVEILDGIESATQRLTNI
jgi:hypothetical protein